MMWMWFLDVGWVQKSQQSNNRRHLDLLWSNTNPSGRPLYAAVCMKNKKYKKVHDERSGAYWEWSQNALGRKNYGKESFFVFLHSEGWWPAAERFLWERWRRWRLFSRVGGVWMEGPSVFMWENINELLPTGRRAAPIISSLENTGGKTETRGERWKKTEMCLFSFSWLVTERDVASQPFATKQQRILGF